MERPDRIDQVQRLSQIFEWLRGRLQTLGIQKFGTDASGVWVEPLDDPAWWDEQRSELVGILVKAKFLAKAAQQTLDRVLPTNQMTAYRVQVLIDRLIKRWLPMLCPGSATGDVDLFYEWIKEVDELAIQLRHVSPLVGTSNSLPSAPEPVAGLERVGDKKPLSEAAQLVYDCLCSLPETESRTASQLSEMCLEKGEIVTDETVRKGIRKQLGPYGLLNNHPGYYIPISRRPGI